MSGAEILSLLPEGDKALTVVLLPDEPIANAVSARRTREGAVRLIVGRSVVEKLGLPAYGRIDGDTLASLLRAGEQREAYQTAIRMLGASDQNRRGLSGKLMRRGFSRETVGKTVERMVSLGYIREGEQARRLAVGMAHRNLWGPRRISCELRAKGFRGEDADQAIKEAEEAGEIDFPALRRALLARAAARGTAPEKLRALLYRYGYGGEAEDADLPFEEQ